MLIEKCDFWIVTLSSYLVVMGHCVMMSFQNRNTSDNNFWDISLLQQWWIRNKNNFVSRGGQRLLCFPSKLVIDENIITIICLWNWSKVTGQIECSQHIAAVMKKSATKHYRYYIYIDLLRDLHLPSYVFYFLFETKTCYFSIESIAWSSSL